MWDSVTGNALRNVPRHPVAATAPEPSELRLLRARLAPAIAALTATSTAVARTGSSEVAAAVDIDAPGFPPLRQIGPGAAALAICFSRFRRSFPERPG